MWSHSDPRSCCPAGVTLKAHSSPLTWVQEKDAVSSCITSNSLLLNTYQKYYFWRNNIHRQYPERHLAHYSMRNVKCLSLYRATSAKSYLSELSCFSSHRIAFLRQTLALCHWPPTGQRCCCLSNPTVIFIVKIVFGDIVHYINILNV